MVASPAPCSSRNSTTGLAYLLRGKAHEDNLGPRSWFVDGIHCVPETAAQQWQRDRERFGKHKMRVRRDENGEPMRTKDGSPQTEGEYVQAVHLVFSYDFSEYDPRDPEEVQQAHQQSVEAARLLVGDFRTVVATQIDGKGGKVHSHVYISSIHPETGRSSRGTDAFRNAAKVRTAVNEVSLRHGRDNVALMEERASTLRLTSADLKRTAAEQYVWKTDLVDRLQATLAGSKSREQWQERAAEIGVEIRRTGRSGTSFGFTDADGKDRKITAKGLGSVWRASKTDKVLEANAAQKVQEQPLPQQLEALRQAMQAQDQEQITAVEHALRAQVSPEQVEAAQQELEHGRATDSAKSAQAAMQQAEQDPELMTEPEPAAPLTFQQRQAQDAELIEKIWAQEPTEAEKALEAEEAAFMKKLGMSDSRIEQARSATAESVEDVTHQQAQRFEATVQLDAPKLPSAEDVAQGKALAARLEEVRAKFGELEPKGGQRSRERMQALEQRRKKREEAQQDQEKAAQRRKDAQASQRAQEAAQRASGDVHHERMLAEHDAAAAQQGRKPINGQPGLLKPDALAGQMQDRELLVIDRSNKAGSRAQVELNAQDPAAPGKRGLVLSGKFAGPAGNRQRVLIAGMKPQLLKEIRDTAGQQVGATQDGRAVYGVRADLETTPVSSRSLIVPGTVKPSKLELPADWEQKQRDSEKRARSTAQKKEQAAAKDVKAAPKSQRQRAVEARKQRRAAEKDQGLELGG